MLFRAGAWPVGPTWSSTVPQHLRPLPRQRLQLPSPHPHLPARPGHLVVRPAGDAERRVPVVGDAGLGEAAGELVQLAPVPLVPAAEVGDGGEAVALAAVAGVDGDYADGVPSRLASGGSRETALKGKRWPVGRNGPSFSAMASNRSRAG
jgi:hypothetical protein